MHALNATRPRFRSYDDSPWMKQVVFALTMQGHVVDHGASMHLHVRRVSWGQSAQTTTREVIELFIIVNGHLFDSTECSTTPK